MSKYDSMILPRAITVFLLLTLTSTLMLRADDRGNGLRKVADDVNWKYTSVGKIGLTITNFGTVGTRNAFWPGQPSCEFPIGSRIEHIYQGGLWIGALVKTRDTTDRRNDEIFVSTAASDRASTSSSQGLISGFEFASNIGDSITEISNLTYNRPSTSKSSQASVSHQDFICDYYDKFTRVPSTQDSIADHTPMGLKVHQESYAWNFPFANAFVILRFDIFNVGQDTLDSVYVGYWVDACVRNTNLVRPGTPGYFDYTGQGFDSVQRMAYSFDFAGTPGGPPADSYVGMKLLGTTPFPTNIDSIGDLHLNTYYNAWQYRSSDPNAQWYAAPTDDYNSVPYFSRYSRLTQSMPQSFITPLRQAPKQNGVSYLLSTGPFSRLNPGDSVEVVYAIVCAKKDGSVPANNDTPDQRKTLYTNAGWAQRAYQGEDVNGNDLTDAGEDIARRDSTGLHYVPDGNLTRYLMPAPPRTPISRTVVQNRSIVLYWDKSTAEESVDPISGQKSFEGYRVYRSNPGEDFLNHDAFLDDTTLVGEFDLPNDNIGYNTGFSRILLDSAKTFPGDTTKYWYQFPPRGVSTATLNGWQYMYAVSAFDKGDSVNGIPSLESAKSSHRVISGTPPTSDNSVQVGVYPNPYYVDAYWDGGQERLRKLYFYNLPAKCQIRIYTLAGDVVAILDHDAATNNGSGIGWFGQFGDRSTGAQFAGGEHAWDLITRFDQAVATGLYLFTVEDKATGTVKRGKFMVVK